MSADQKAKSPGGAELNADTKTDSTSIPQDCPDRKRIANLKAQLALKGFAVHEVISGGYFCSKWNLTKFCPALQDLEAFAAQVGARA